MQNSNSMWKLTALAGAVGLGLLVIMQVKSSMDKTSAKTADVKGKSDLKDFRPKPDLTKLDSFGLEAPTEVTRTTKRSKKPSVDLTPDDSDRTTTSSSSTNRSRNSARSLARELDELNLEQGDPEPAERGASAMNLANGEPTPADDADDPFTNSSPKSRNSRRTNSVDDEARDLLKLARKLIDDGLLDDAKDKANEAAALAASYGPLDDTPDAVLEDIAKLKTPSRKPTRGNPDAISLAGNDDQPATLSLDEAEIEQIPKKKKPSLLDADLFADNPPEAPKGVKREPDPPIPPAEEPSGSDIPEFADDLPLDAAPAKSKPVLDSVPSKLRPLATDDDDLDKVLGNGTVRPDAPRGPQRPELKIEKVAPPNAVLGKPLVYTIVIRNVGESQANQVVVEDQIPQGTSLSGTIPRAELSGKTLVWRIGTIAPGETKDIQVKVVPVSEGQIGSVATVSFQAEVAARTNVSAPHLSLRINGPQQVRLGDPATLNFTITNNAQVEATRVVLRNLIPDNLKLDGLSERDLEYDVGTIGPGKSTNIQLPLVTVRPGRAINKAVITTDGVTAAEGQAEVNVIGQLVGLTRHGPTSTFANKPIEFENRIVNHSLSATRNTVIVETLPRTVEFVSASDGAKYDSRYRTVTWNLSHLDPQQTQSLRIKLIAKTTGTHPGSITISEAGRKGSTTEYQFKTVGAANLSLDFPDKAEAYSRGEQFTLRMVVKNKGSGEATNVGLRLRIPDELQFVSLRGPVSHSVSGQQLILEPIPEIGGQGAVNLELTFRAVAAGDSTLQVEIQSDQFKKAVTQEEPVVIFSGGSN